MITGDHKVTAAAIAKRIGILENESEACEGAEIDRMSVEELKNFVEGISVYARVSPEHKIRIVRAWQDKGNIVSMTGDGVNDAPALKQADIGVAMGITGSEVSKDAAAMVLTDDNFATIVKAVENGKKYLTGTSRRQSSSCCPAISVRSLRCSMHRSWRFPCPSHRCICCSSTC